MIEVPVLLNESLKRVDRVYNLDKDVKIIASVSRKHKLQIHVIIDGKSIINLKDQNHKVSQTNSVNIVCKQPGMQV